MFYAHTYPGMYLGTYLGLPDVLPEICTRACKNLIPLAGQGQNSWTGLRDNLDT